MSANTWEVFRIRNGKPWQRYAVVESYDDGTPPLYASKHDGDEKPGYFFTHRAAQARADDLNFYKRLVRAWLEI